MTGQQVPKVQNSSVGVIVRHKEFVGNVQPTSTFDASAYPLNPGLDVTFPWLSQIAPAFQQYRWRGLIFTYKSTSADLVSTTNTSLGSVIMATDYDAVSPDIQTKREMLNYEFSATAKPSTSFIHMIETAKSQTYDRGLLYTRDGPVPVGADKRLYDIGTFYIATDGMQNPGVTTAQIGELWVSYEIEFLKPKFGLSTGVESDVWYMWPDVVDAQYRLIGDPIYAKRFGTLGTTLSLSGTPEATFYNLGQVVFPRDTAGKTFQVTYMLKAAAGTGTTPISPLIELNNCVFTAQQNELESGDVGDQNDYFLNNITTVPASFSYCTSSSNNVASSCVQLFITTVVTISNYYEADPPYVMLRSQNATEAVYPVFNGTSDCCLMIITEIAEGAWQNSTTANDF